MAGSGVTPHGTFWASCAVRLRVGGPGGICTSHSGFSAARPAPIALRVVSPLRT